MRSDWDDEPVEWCARCGSLYVLDVGGVCYCGKCGCARMMVGDIEEWEARYGRSGEGDDVGKKRGQTSGFGFIDEKLEENEKRKITRE